MKPISEIVWQLTRSLFRVSPNSLTRLVNSVPNASPSAPVPLLAYPQSIVLSFIVVVDDDVVLLPLRTSLLFSLCGHLNCALGLRHFPAWLGATFPKSPIDPLNSLLFSAKDFCLSKETFTDRSCFTSNLILSSLVGFDLARFSQYQLQKNPTHQSFMHLNRVFSSSAQSSSLSFSYRLQCDNELWRE